MGGTIVHNPEFVDRADIIVGIPSYHEADSIAYPTDVASRGLVTYFGHKSGVIINVDNNSADGTRDAFLSTPTKVPKIYISTPEGVKGKGNNVRNLFEAAVELGARAVVMVDADLKSISPQWIQYLGEPLFSGFNYVTPIYQAVGHDKLVPHNQLLDCAAAADHMLLMAHALGLGGVWLTCTEKTAGTFQKKYGLPDYIKQGLHLAVGWAAIGSVKSRRLPLAEMIIPGPLAKG